MSPTKDKLQKSNHPSVTILIGRALRRYFLTGLVTLLPVVITIWIILRIFQWADGLLGRYLKVQVPGFGLVVTLFLILVVGFFVIHLFGRSIFKALEVWFNRLPLVRRIYPAIKQLAQFLFSEDERKKAFRKTVLVEYPRKGIYALGFVTHEETTDITGTSKRLLTVLIPQPPSPVTGPIIFFPEDEVVALDIPIENAMKLIISGGVVSSPLKGSPSNIG